MCGGLVVEVLQQRRFEAGFLIGLVPGQQDLFLVGARADDDLQPGNVRRLLDLTDLAGALDVKAEHILAVGGEVKTLFARLGHGDVADHRVVFARADAQGPVFPAGLHYVELQAKAVGYQLGGVGLAADGGLVVTGQQRQRWPGYA